MAPQRSQTCVESKAIPPQSGISLSRRRETKPTPNRSTLTRSPRRNRPSSISHTTVFVQPDVASATSIKRNPTFCAFKFPKVDPNRPPATTSESDFPGKVPHQEWPRPSKKKEAAFAASIGREECTFEARFPRCFLCFFPEAVDRDLFQRSFFLGASDLAGECVETIGATSLR